MGAGETGCSSEALALAPAVGVVAGFLQGSFGFGAGLGASTDCTATLAAAAARLPIFAGVTGVPASVF